MPSPKWKQFERDIASHAAGGKRQGSRGVAEADVLADNLTFECKSRNDVPKWLLDAFDQSGLNARLYPDRENFVALGAHFGRGNPIRVFIAKEVILKDTDLDNLSDLFKELMAQLIPPAAKDEELELAA